MSDDFQAGVAAERARVAIYVRRWERLCDYLADRRTAGGYPGADGSRSQAGLLRMVLGFVIDGGQLPAPWQRDPVPTTATIAEKGAAIV